MALIHLHTHMEYNLLDSFYEIKELTARVEELGMDSMAVTGHDVMHGIIDFYKATRGTGIKLTLGYEVYVTPGSHFDRETVSGKDRYYHLVLLAGNNKGYENLIKVVSGGFVDGFYYKPKVDCEMLRIYREETIVLNARPTGEVQRCLTRGMYEETIRASERYVDILGKDNSFLEFQDHGLPNQRLVNQGLMRMSRGMGLELVAINDIHYTYAEDEKAHDILLCIQASEEVADEDRTCYEGGQYYCKSEEEMRALSPYASEAIENTYMIAGRCNVEIEFGITKLPKYGVPESFSSWSYLNCPCREGLETRYPDNDGTLSSRLNYELDIIRSMGCVDYFLIVWDFTSYARSQDITVGPGWGPAAGSIVSYTLGITNIDPACYNPLFECFLNSKHVSMPDIDIDSCYERCWGIVDYVVREYGRGQVVQIVTFGTPVAKGVVHDVGRALGLPYSLYDTIIKMVLGDLGMTLDKVLATNPDLRKAYNEGEQVHYLIDTSRRLGGLPGHTSTHAAGVAIGSRSIDELVPLSKASDGTIATQFTMTATEELGLLKMDFLGLRTLTVIQNTVRPAEKDYGITTGIDHIDFDGKKVLESIGVGRTEGVFQLESAGAKSFMKELKMENLEGIIVGISLHRPDPMDFILKHLRGKNDRAPIAYDRPQPESVLGPTYDCIMYQGQVMQIIRDLAGYTTGRSDLVHRAMSKKKTSVMEKEHQNFAHGNQSKEVKGCVNNGINERTVNHICDGMISFAKHAFNKSHATVYTVVSYQTVYLKYYYPREFMVILTALVMDNVSKFLEYVLTYRRMMGIPVLPLDTNEGESGFSVSGDVIRYGLSVIKSADKPVTGVILAERKRNGSSRFAEDFVGRMSMKEVNKGTLENFIKSGALDTLPGTRQQKMAMMPIMLEEEAREKKPVLEGQLGLFDTADEKDRDESQTILPDVGECSKGELLASEKEILGAYISGHSLGDYEDTRRRSITATSAQLIVDEETNEVGMGDGSRAVIGGLMAGKTVKTTRINQLMAFIMLENLLGSVEVIVFPRDYEASRDLFTEDPKLFIRGRVSIGDGPVGKLVYEQVIPFDNAPKELWLQPPDMETYQVEEQCLLTSLRPSEGKDRVVTYLQRERAKKVPPANWNMQITSELLEEPGKGLGEENVRVIEKGFEKLGKMD